MQQPFKAYAGSEPFVFVSYAHADAEAVYGELARIHDVGVNLWYDEGIFGASVWADEIANAIERSNALLFFLTESSSNSRTCANEVTYAYRRGKPIIVVQSYDVSTPPGLELLLGATQSITRDMPLDPESRDELLAAIRTRMSGRDAGLPAEARPHLPTIEVRPFRCFSNAEPWLGEAISDDLTSLLARTAAFTVVQGGGDDPDYVLSGSIQRRSESLHINARLMETKQNRIIWSQSGDNDASDIFMLQDRIASGIASALGSNIWQLEAERTAFENPSDLTAWELMSRASLFFTGSIDRAEAEALLRRAIALEPQYDYAVIGLASLLQSNVVFKFSADPTSELAEARALYARVESRNPRDPRVVGRMGIFQIHDGDSEKAYRLLSYAHELLPHWISAKAHLGFSMYGIGRQREGVALLEQVLDEHPDDPLRSLWQGYAALGLAALGQLERAIELMKESTRDGGGMVGNLWVAVLSVAVDDRETARSAIAAQRRTTPHVGLDEWIAYLSDNSKEGPERDFLIGALKGLWFDEI